MAVETTPLGFKKPDGNDPVRNGENHIATNAQRSQDLHAAALDRLGKAEAAINAGAGGPGLSEDPLHPGLYYFAGPAFTADPDHPGLYLIGE
ncbi:hypothetical protein [Paenarthrobacter sp. Y-19]|uniref:hypothetical protein n=1 Tax=Paenarthrobacter sp. Y-19 TaxID=3031125 RepID=UPI0023DCC7FA|nr:hypothetical protein [Paenarthrobacter sp. Y-19]